MLIESEGSLINDFRSYLDEGYFLAVMPIARVHLDLYPKRFPGGVTFYPSGLANLEELGIIPNRENSKSLAEVVSHASGINEEELDENSLVVFPCTFRWQEFRNNDFRSHSVFIRTLSEYVDNTCLNYIRYCQCPIENVGCLPGSAGTVNSNHMMAGALLYNSHIQESRIIGGDPFTHFITRGLGLSIDSIEFDLFPKKGEVGSIVNHALSLYTALLEASNPTLRFIQALNILEFLAYPDEYKKFEEVKKVIARYVAKNNSEYRILLERFFELTGKKEADTGQIIGYRTRLVHMGERIDDIVPDEKERSELFIELGGYIKSVIDHMNTYSNLDFDEYLSIREKTLRLFER